MTKTVNFKFAGQTFRRTYKSDLNYLILTKDLDKPNAKYNVSGWSKSVEEGISRAQAFKSKRITSHATRKGNGNYVTALIDVNTGKLVPFEVGAHKPTPAVPAAAKPVKKAAQKPDRKLTPETFRRDIDRLNWRVDFYDKELADAKQREAQLKKRIEALEVLNNEMGLALLSLNGFRDRAENHIRSHREDIIEALDRIEGQATRLKKLSRKITKLKNKENIDG